MLKARGRVLSCKVLFYHPIIIIFGRTRSTAFYFIVTSSAVAFSALFSQTSEAAAELLFIYAVVFPLPLTKQIIAHIPGQS